MKKIIVLIISLGFVVSSCYTKEELNQAKIIDSKFPVGSLVQLKSGGPKMTIVTKGGGFARCAWMSNDGSLKYIKINLESLKKIE